MVDLISDESNVKLSVEIKLMAYRGVMHLYCVVPAEYPWQPVKFRIGDAFNYES